MGERDGRPPAGAASEPSGPPELSLVIPVYNEAECIAELHAQLDLVLKGLGKSAEIIFVDDGSSDGSAALLDDLAGTDPRVSVAHFRRNFGKSAALDAGFHRARGATVITLDADLQDDPREIPRFLDKLAEGFDMVSGWKRKRHDPLDKTLPSRLFNWFTRLVSGLALHDFNCGFKAYTAESLADLRLHGELHRYIPVLLHWQGFRVGEIEVAHRPRLAGVSKFGARRLVTGAFDLMTVILTAKFRSRPLHFFGYLALAFGLIGGAGLGWLFALSVLEIDPLRPRPLLYGSILLILTSVSLIATGLLGELVKSLSPDARDYRIRPPARPEGRPRQSRDHARRD